MRHVLKAGTVVKIEGFPIKLCADVEVESKQFDYFFPEGGEHTEEDVGRKVDEELRAA